MSIRFHGKVKCKIISSKNAKKKEIVESKSSTMKFLKHQCVEKKSLWFLSIQRNNFCLIEHRKRECLFTQLVYNENCNGHKCLCLGSAYFTKIEKFLLKIL